MINSHLIIQQYRKLRSLLGAQVFVLFLLASIVGILWFACETLFIYVFQAYLASLGLLTTTQSWIPNWFPKGIESAVGLMILFGTLRAILYAVRTYLTQASMGVFVSSQRRYFLRFFLSVSNKQKTSEMLHLFSDVIQQSGQVVGQLSSLLMTASAVLLYFVFLIRLAWIEALLGVGLLALLALPLTFISKRVTALGQQVYREHLDISEYLLMGLRNWTYLKIHRLTEKQIQSGEQSLDRALLDIKTFSRFLGLGAALPLFLGILIISAISVVSVQWTKTDPMTLVSFFYIFLRLAQSGSELNTTLGQLKMNWIGVQTLYHWHQLRLVSEQIPQGDALTTTQVQTIKNGIEVDGVKIHCQNLSFGWDPQHLILKNLNFELKKGDVLLIKGPSGAGKSSLLQIILGLNSPTQGSVEINGVKPAQFFDSFANCISYVGPEPMLIPGTIKQNLEFGLPQGQNSSSEQELLQVLKQVSLEFSGPAFPNGLHTILSEKTELSSGQKQRLALARAILKKPKLLILDEVTSNLDAENNERIVEIIRALSQHMTVLIVSHRQGFEPLATKNILLGHETI